MRQAVRISSSLPNFIVIGAAKAGTTSLYHYLSGHPEIFLPRIKESYFFLASDGPLNFNGPSEKYTINRDAISSWREYADLFRDAGGFPARGEVCPGYLRIPGAAERILDGLGPVKILAILRNPVERAFSEYCMRRGLGIEDLGFEEALAAEAGRLRDNWYGGRYRSGGLYGELLADYYRRFPRENIRILLFDEFVASPRTTLGAVCDFLEVSRFEDWDISERHNRSGDINNPLVNFLWTRSNKLRDRIRPLLPLALRRAVSRSINRLPRTKPVLEAGVAARLAESYARDISACEQLTGIDLRHWRCPARSLPLGAGQKVCSNRPL